MLPMLDTWLSRGMTMRGDIFSQRRAKKKSGEAKPRR
jgi:hypothetical protein